MTTTTTTYTPIMRNVAAIGLGCAVYLRRDAAGVWTQVRHDPHVRGFVDRVMAPTTVLRHLDDVESGAADDWIDGPQRPGSEMPVVIRALLIP